MLAVVRGLPFFASRVAWFAVLLALFLWFLDYQSRAPDMFNEESWHVADPMSFSGFAAVIFGIMYSVLVDRSQRSLLSQWHDAAIIDLKPGTRQNLEDDLWRKRLVCLAVFPVPLVVFTAVGYTNVSEKFNPFLEFWLASFLCTFLIGLRVARLVGHGLNGWLIECHGVPFSMTIGHPDRGGGTARIGTFYFLQASVLAIPAIWLSVWIFLIPYFPEYRGWENHFVSLLTAVVVVFVIGFLLPVTSFRRLIGAWKVEHTFCEIESVRGELLHVRSVQEPSPTQFRDRSELARRLDELTRLPNWPVSPAVRNAFITIVITFLLELTFFLFAAVLQLQ